MIAIKDYRDYWLTVKTAVSDIKRMILVSKESQLAEAIKEIQNEDIILAVVVPSANSRPGDTDNFGMNNNGLLYVIQKLDRSSISQINDSANANDALIDYLATTQTAIQKVIAKMKADKDSWTSCNLMKKLDLTRMNIDPEFDYLGCFGWSLSFIFETGNF